MSDILVRGIPKRIHEQLRRLAKSHNLSVNQVMLKLIHYELERLGEETKEAENRFSSLSRN